MLWLKIILIWVALSILLGFAFGRVIKNGERREKKMLEELKRQEMIRKMFR